MKLRKFLAMNSWIIGTIIIISGFAWMFALAAIATPVSQTMIAFFYTISGIGFWAIGFYSGTDPIEKIKKKPTGKKASIQNQIKGISKSNAQIH